MTEYNLDSMIGPTHHFGGLSKGNLASMAHQFQMSSPKKAALEGLEKMRLAHEIGQNQLWFPPQRRPIFDAMINGAGSDIDKVRWAFDNNPELLSQLFSSSAMWMANNATVSGSADSSDGLVHVIPANLSTLAHRRVEVAQNLILLNYAFFTKQFKVHPPLSHRFRDEGAANHMQFSTDGHSKSLHLFVYNRSKSGDEDKYLPFPLRQSYEASRSLAKAMNIPETQTLICRQLATSVQKGVFHHDVVGMSHQDVLIIHELALEDQDHTLQLLQTMSQNILKKKLTIIQVSSEQLSLKEALDTYFFNSQFIKDQDGNVHLICAQQCNNHPKVSLLVDDLIAQKVIEKVHYISLSESMMNGGGPACLRLRLPLTSKEFSNIPNCFKFSDEKYQEMVHFVHQFYPNQVRLADFIQINFLKKMNQLFDGLYSLFFSDL